jgi:hypothetical protein
MSIRQGLAADSVRLAALGADSFMAAFAAFNRPEDMKTYAEEAFSLDRLEAELQDTRSTFLLAERQGELLGYAKLRHYYWYRRQHPPCCARRETGGTTANVCGPVSRWQQRRG